MVQSNPVSEVVRGTKTENRTRPANQEPRSTPLDQPTVSSPKLAMPDYVERRHGATENDRLSTEALVREYEAAEKEIESMGGELLARVKQCEAMTRDALAVTAELKEIAARYRQEAKRVFDHIENCSLMVSEARKTAAELRDKFATPLASEKLKQKRK